MPGSEIRDAVIIAGGRGERLRPLTDSVPKPLLEVAGKPIIEWQVARLEAAGVTRIAVVGRYLFEQFEDYFEQRGSVAEILLVREDSPLGRGGAIRAGWLALDAPAAVYGLNSDIVSDANIVSLDGARRASGADASLLIVPLRSPYGIVEVEDGLVVQFREKPVLDDWINGGIYALGGAALERFPENGDHEDSTFPMLAREGRLAALRHAGAWRSVDSPKDLLEADQLMAAAAAMSAPGGRIS